MSPKTNHGEPDADFYLDVDFNVIQGGVEVVRSSQRKVLFNDCSLTQVIEFQPR
jgi:hypothetical protein